MEIQPVVLWILWRNEDGRLRKVAPPVPPQAKKLPTFRCRLDELYELALYLSVADRILAAKSISKDEVMNGHRYITKYNRGAIALGIPLVINNHLAMHYPTSYQFGPTYAWWLFGFERCNGDQKKVNLNGHANGEMELTLARAWVLKHRLYELVGSAGILAASLLLINLKITSLPPNANTKEKDLINRLTREHGSARGTLQTQIAGFANEDAIISPKRKGAPADLRKLGLYPLLLAFSQHHRPHLNISDDFSICPPGSTILSGARSTVSLAYIFKAGTRYGCSTSAVRTAGTATGDHFACIDVDQGRHPCKILHHLLVTVPGEAPIHVCVFQKMLSDDNIPVMPWDL